MNELKLCYDGSLRSKRNPDRYEVIDMNDRLPDFPKTVNQENIKRFVELVSKYGMPFCPATFKDSKDDFYKGKGRAENFDQMQLFALEFNNKITFEAVKKRTNRYNLPILFAYEMIGSTGHHFTVVFLNDISVTALRVAEAMQKALLTIFPEADKSCEDVIKINLGGNKLLYFDETVPDISIDSLIIGMTLCLRNRYGPTNYKRKIAEFAEKTGVRLNDRKLLDVSVDDNLTEVIRNNPDTIDNKNSPNPTMIVSGFGEKLSTSSCLVNLPTFPTEDSAAQNLRATEATTHRAYRSEVIKTLSSNCQLYQEFKSGSRVLPQSELLGLASNLIQVETGDKRFKAILSTKAYFDDQPEKYGDWDFYFYYIKDKGPRPCISFCPHQDKCSHGKNILSTTKPKYHQIERIANHTESLCSVDEAWADFKRCFLSAINSPEKLWHVIKCQTALGKTQAYLELLRDTGLRVLVVVPTNKLKREISLERAAEMGIDFIVSPSLHELKEVLPDYIWDDIESLYDAGKSPMSRVNKAISEDDFECAGAFRQYKRELDEFNNSTDGRAISTHRRLANMDVSKYDLVIIDEDIIFSTVIQSRADISVSNLKKVKKELAASGPLATKIKKIIDRTQTDEFFTLDEIDYDRTYAGIKMAVNIPALCSATHFCYRKASKMNDLTEDVVSFVRPMEFKGNTKYIMLSATANKDICEYCFGEDNVKFYGCKEAKLTGTLNLYSDKTMSRAYIAKDPTIIDRIKAWTKCLYTISFKKYKLNDLYFGNTAGCNHLAGKDIDVIGTPHQQEWIYKLFAFSLGFDVGAKLKPNTTATHNGYRFRFTTYDDEVLRAIQFYMIESELEQSVGRARLLRCNCTVNLFSNFPLSQANLIISEYDND